MRVLIASAAVVASAAILSAQTLDQKTVEQELRSYFQVSKVALFNPSVVDRPGGVYVVQADGIQSEAMTQSDVVQTTIAEGKLKATTDKGAGALFSSITTGRKRDEARILKKGERVYVTKIEGYRNGLSIELATVDTTPIVDQGRTRQMAYKADLMFTNDRGRFPEVSDISALTKIIDQFIVSESVASAPKTIELGQSIADVEALLGKPVSIAKLGTKTIYTYKEMKVIFLDGKVNDVQ